ncbi:MAG TPA: DUF6788 family protein [Terriglobia bacterium]|nr:DUF6788 family protein [Terriglobia bacterium]
MLTSSDSYNMSIGMMDLGPVRRRLARLQRQLRELGPLHPGTISEQYNVCGQPGCRCKDPNNPQRHGPYYQLSFTWRGKGSTRFLRPEQVEPMRRKVANYKRLRDLMSEWVQLEIERERAEREKEKRAGGD